uniref:ABC2_membrane domain-containing protein n=1 Tax=Heterorhabditis bacteriophora TaxID=37862 RepID=A0A1I7W5X7_HETBA
MVSEVSLFWPPNWSCFVQLSALHWRNTKTILREPTLLKVQLVQSIIIAILTGIFYLGNTISQEQVMNINGSLFQMVTNMAFMFQFSVVNVGECRSKGSGPLDA